MRTATFDVVSALAAIVITLVGAIPVFLAARRNAGRVTAGDAVRSGGAILAATVAACFFLSPLGVTVFGDIRLIYFGAVIALPAIGVALLVLRAAGRVTPTRGATVLAALASLAAPLGVWTSFIEPGRLVLETATLDLPVARSGREPVRIAILSDLQCNHVGDRERASVEMVLAQKADIIFIPGDLFHGDDDEWARESAALHELLARLDAPGGVYFVIGDVDSAARTIPMLRGTKVRPLLDEVVKVRVRDRDITIGGISWMPQRVLSDLTVRERGEKAAADASDVRILLCHRPDAVLELEPSSRVDLVVAGHTHGGQIVIPGFGPLMTLSSVPRHVAAGGLHRVDGNAIYVSRGAGMERRQAPAMRLFCPPEVSLVTLRSAAREEP